MKIILDGVLVFFLVALTNNFVFVNKKLYLSKNTFKTTYGREGLFCSLFVKAYSDGKNYRGRNVRMFGPWPPQSGGEKGWRNEWRNGVIHHFLFFYLCRTLDHGKMPFTFRMGLYVLSYVFLETFSQIILKWVFPWRF